MKLSNKTEYAILALMELGQRYGKGYVLSREIAHSRDIPGSFLERILLGLRNAGIVMSYRGANGGHCLARDPKDISIREVIETFEGSLAPADCVNERSQMPMCPVEACCVIKDLWQKMYDSMLESVENVTLNDLLLQEKQGQEAAMYYI
ncbi:MAG: RrF2 family transcriptional regulator [Candidatus Brocadiales bacterium]